MNQAECQVFLEAQALEAHTLTQESNAMIRIRPATAKMIALEAETLRRKAQALHQYWLNLGLNLDLDLETLQRLGLKPILAQNENETAT